MAEQKFDISIDRVDKIPVPLLVVGLGGTGCDVLQTIKTKFAERYVLPKNSKGQDLPAPEKTAYLGLDSLSQKPDGLEVSEYVDISLAGIDKILLNQKELLNSDEKTWVNRNLRHTATGIGMGTVRQAARLALSRNYEKVRSALKGALNSIVSVASGTGDGRVNQVEIVVVTGIGGGTGSGIFLDVAQILRSVAKETTVIPAKLTGYIVMPDVSLANVTAASGMEGPIKHNAYAALKELDFWMRVKQHETAYSMKYGNGTELSWTEPPFDYCILMSSSNVEGVPYKDGYTAVRNTIAENLMHYMAKEDGVGTQYSYRQYEDNLAAIKIKKSYPLYYGYRAIGAFTKRIPKKPILYYEGTKLLDTFIPLRDDNNQLQPDRRMFTDGQGKKRAEEITGIGKQLLHDYQTNICKLPSFCGLDLNDKVKVAGVQNLNPAPHSKWHRWRDEHSAPTALKASVEYLNKAWARFNKFAMSIITDPKQGPFALEKYLDAPDGLISYLNETLESWNSQYNKTRNQSIAQAEEMCVNAWPGFRNPPILGRKSALEQYDHAIRTLYTYVNNCEFLEKHTEALEKLILRIKEYLRDGLKPMCASVLYLQTEFGTTDQTDSVLVQDIYSVATVQKSIDDAFEDANSNNQMSCRFLEKLGEISFLTQPNVDAKTSGVEFICRNIGLNEMCQAIQSDMEEVYGSVNNQSLDAIMVANVGEDINAQQKWMDALANSALDSALPMFMQDSIFKSEQVAPYSYMSIPQNAKEHLHYIKEAFKSHDPAVEPKASSLEDHIYVLNAWDKLPLYRYGMMEDLRIAYDADLNVQGSEGLHLVRNGDPDASFMSDWSQLPSPKPYFLFAKNSVNNEVQQYKKVHDLVNRGIAAGMITVRDDQPFAAASVKVMMADNGIAVLTANTILDQKKQLIEEKNPLTGVQYSKKENAARLTEYLKKAKTFLLAENEVKPANVAHVIGLEHEPCDPFDSSIQASIDDMAKAKENHKKLCVVMVEAMIYNRPDLLRALELQVPAFEDITAEIKSAASGEEIWKKRTEYADTAADMFIFLDNMIFLGGEGYKYKDKTGKYDIVTPNLMAEDLKKVDSLLLRSMCFLADAPEENAAKADLTKALSIAKREYNDALDSEEMTAEDMQELIEAANTLVTDLEEEKNNAEHAAHVDLANAEEILCQVEMFEAVRKAAASRAHNFKKILKGLD